MKSKKYVTALLAIVCLLIVSSWAMFSISKSRRFQFFGELISRVKTDEKVVALTFDDAPSSRVIDVLNVLQDKQVKATFFEIGTNIETYPEIALAIVEAGMEVGNHSYTHERMIFKSLSFIDTEIQKTNELIRKSGYTGEITFRPPNGKKLFLLPWYLNKQGIKTIMWDVEPDTYVSGDTNAIVAYTLSHVRPGSIILLHPFCEEVCQSDREALPFIIDGLIQQGYRLVTVHELIQ